MRTAPSFAFGKRFVQVAAMDMLEYALQLGGVRQRQHDPRKGHMITSTFLFIDSCTSIRQPHIGLKLSISCV